MTNVRTYSGSSLEELLPQIRAELGNDAMIVRQREGVVGGIGGFFGRRIVEVEARPASGAAVPPRPAAAAAATATATATLQSVPARKIVDAYDTGGGAPTPVFEPELAVEDEPQFEPHFEPQFEREQEPATSALFEMLLEQAAPFVAEERPVVEAPPSRPKPPNVQQTVTPTHAALVPVAKDEFQVVRGHMLAAALPAKLVEEIIEEVQQHLLPFEPGASIRALVRRSLASRLPTAYGWRTKRRTIAVVGLGGSGRTLAVASLCAAYSAAGRTVAALSLEHAREAMPLAEALRDRHDIDFQIADAPDLVTRAKKAAGDADVLIADTPPIAAAVDGAPFEETLALLKALRPDETHLVLAAGTEVAEAKAMIDALAPHKLPNRIIITHPEDPRAHGGAVGLALASRIPISFVTEGTKPWRLRPAQPEGLARMVLR
jgi:flagellar biosynthesis protein FlhF